MGGFGGATVTEIDLLVIDNYDDDYHDDVDHNNHGRNDYDDYYQAIWWLGMSEL